MDDLFGPLRPGAERLPAARRELEFLAPEDPGPPEAGGFSSLLEKAVSDVTGAQAQARERLEGLATGSTQDIHEVMVAMGKSEVAFQLMLEVRNKLVEAWKEITRLPI